MQGLIEEVIGLLHDKNMLVVTAESCTGGKISAALTDIAGASKVFERGYVVYSNRAKVEVLGVSERLLEQHGAVSAEIAIEMAQRAIFASHAKLAVSCTGIAGPGGATPEKRVGTVFIAIAYGHNPPKVFAHNFRGDREDVRNQATEQAFLHIRDALQEEA